MAVLTGFYQILYRFCQELQSGKYAQYRFSAEEQYYLNVGFCIHFPQKVFALCNLGKHNNSNSSNFDLSMAFVALTFHTVTLCLINVTKFLQSPFQKRSPIE